MKTAKVSCGRSGEDTCRKPAVRSDKLVPGGNRQRRGKGSGSAGCGFGIDNPAVYLPAVLIPVLAGIGAVIYRKRRTA